MDNPVFEDNSEVTAKRNTNFLVQPTHTRSGSCPSKLTQTENARKDHAAFGSHRIKPVRERSSLQGFVFFFSHSILLYKYQFNHLFKECHMEQTRIHIIENHIVWMQLL